MLSMIGFDGVLVGVMGTVCSDMLMPLHHFCFFNFRTCESLYNHFVFIETCKYYTLLRTCV